MKEYKKIHLDLRQPRFARYLLFHQPKEPFIINVIVNIINNINNVNNNHYYIDHDEFKAQQQAKQAHIQKMQKLMDQAVVQQEN